MDKQIKLMHKLIIDLVEDARLHKKTPMASIIGNGNFVAEQIINSVYNQALEDLLKVMKERADDCSDIPNMFDKGYYQAYEHMCYEAEQLKK